MGDAASAGQKVQAGFGRMNGLLVGAIARGGKLRRADAATFGFSGCRRHAVEADDNRPRETSASGTSPQCHAHQRLRAGAHDDARNAILPRRRAITTKPYTSARVFATTKHYRLIIALHRRHAAGASRLRSPNLLDAFLPKQTTTVPTLEDKPT